MVNKKILNKPPKKATKKSIKTNAAFKKVSELDKAIFCVNEIKNKGIDLTADYSDWINLGFAFANDLGETGRPLFLDLSSLYKGFDQKECNKKYDNFLKTQKGKFTLGTFFAFCQSAGVLFADMPQFQKVRSTKHRNPPKSKDKPKPAQAAVKWDKVPEKPENAGKIEKMEWYIQNHFKWRRNEITRRIEFVQRDQYEWNDLQDKDINTIYIDVNKQGIKAGKEFVSSYINSDYTPTYNPINTFIDKHKGIETGGEIARLCQTVQTDTGQGETKNEQSFFQYFFTKWFVGMVASIDQPLPNPLVLVLTGVQNTGKTYFFRNLLPLELRPFYAESKLDDGKDSDILMTKKIIILDDEFGGKSKRESKRLKELTSKNEFTIREPYGRAHVTLKRLASLCGTSNDEAIIFDPTGNRRIIPINVISRDFQAFDKIDKTKLFIEAYKLYKNGYKWELDKEDIFYLNQNTIQNEYYSIEHETIVKLFDLPSSGGFVEQLTATEIMEYIKKSMSIDRLSKTKLGLELKKIGFKQMVKKEKGKAKRIYSVVKIQGNQPPEAVTGWLQV